MHNTKKNIITGLLFQTLFFPPSFDNQTNRRNPRIVANAPANLLKMPLIEYLYLYV
ncbi:UNVERIFIED_CONTAM: hypothetical protein PYX00_001352 [Menopon gallinae]|uniref:Uncharacterized protein n=1 Tax=Menopon gallinae TaxID=328185 RepID=A0AAW2ICF3_9NEOP